MKLSKAGKLFKDIDSMTNDMRAVVMEMKKKPAVDAAIDYVALRATVDELVEKMKELNKLKNEAQYTVLPAVFERDKATTLTLEIGYRVSMSNYTNASMISKEKA